MRYYETIGLIHPITRDASSKHRVYNEQDVKEQVELLETQKRRLAEEAHYLELRQRYVAIKIAYWQAVASGDTQQIEATREQTYAIAQELKLPKEVSKEEAKEG